MQKKRTKLSHSLMPERTKKMLNFRSQVSEVKVKFKNFKSLNTVANRLSDILDLCFLFEVLDILYANS